MKNWKCALLGHRDPVIEMASDAILSGKGTRDEYFDIWNTAERTCIRCGTSVKPV